MYGTLLLFLACRYKRECRRRRTGSHIAERATYSPGPWGRSGTGDICPASAPSTPRLAACMRRHKAAVSWGPGKQPAPVHQSSALAHVHTGTKHAAPK